MLLLSQRSEFSEQSILFNIIKLQLVNSNPINPSIDIIKKGLINLENCGKKDERCN